MVSGPLSGVAVPAMSRLAVDRDRLHRYYLRILRMLSLIAGPIAGISYVASNEIVSILLGPRWSPAGEVFKYLAISGLLQPLYNTQAWLHLAVGRSDRVFRWGLIGTPIIVTSFVVGLLWGINGVALCYSMAIIIVSAGSLWYAGRSAGLSFRRILGAVYKPILSCVVAVSITSVLAWFISADSSFAALVGKSVAFLFAYVLALLSFYRGFAFVDDLAAAVGAFAGRREMVKI